MVGQMERKKVKFVNFGFMGNYLIDLKPFRLFQLIPNFYFIIQFYYEKQDVCQKPDPNIFKIGRVTRVFINWPISDQFFKNLKNLKISANF